MQVTWDPYTPTPPPPSSPLEDLDKVDWRQVAINNRCLDPERDYDPLVQPQCPELDTLTAIAVAIDADTSTEFEVPLDSAEDAASVAANAAALAQDPDHDLAVASAHAFAATTPGPDTTHGDTALPAMGGPDDTVTDNAADVTQLRREVFALCADGAYHKDTSKFLPEGAGVANESDMVDRCGDHALMQSTDGFHIIDTTRIDGMVGATDQPDPREETVDAVCCDDLRISKDENLKLPANLRVALAGEHGKRWAKAWGKEASSFKEGKTFTTIKVKDMPRSARGCA